jgi:membrane fusion protein (multidrug efflux system)
MHNVETGERVGDRWVIEQGLKPGDRIIVEGLQKAQPGTVVAPKPYQPAESGAAGGA